jgi:hypothetical protein
MDTDYPPDDGKGIFLRRDIEASRRRQEWRILWIRIGDIFRELARAWVLNTGIGGRPNLRHAGKACGLLVKAADAYQTAGLTWQARVMCRYARLLHLARSREAGI